MALLQVYPVMHDIRDGSKYLGDGAPSCPPTTMSTVTSPIPPTSTSTSARYSLEVEYISDATRKRNFADRKSRLYVEVTLGDITDRSCSIKEDSSQPWKHTFTLLSSEQTLEITIGVIQLSAVQKKSTSVGSCNFKLDQLVEQCKAGDAELALSSQLGLLRIRLVVINAISYAAINIRNVGGETSGRGSGRLSRLMGFTSQAGGFVASQLDENGDIYTDIGDLLQKLDVFSQVAGDIASIEPHLKAAWTAISALYKGVSNQNDRDRRVIGLMRKLLEKFKFVDTNESLRNKTLFLKSPIKNLLKITEECCVFIKRYFDRLFFRRMISIRDGQQIDHFESSIDGLTKMFVDDTRRYDEAVKKQTDLRIHLRPSDMEGFGRPRCLENTQLETRRQINEWIDSKTEKRVLWLHGVAGSGKSTIATTIAEELRETRQLGAFLFFDRATSKPKDVIRTMAYKLAMSNPVIATHVTDDAFGDNANYASAKMLLDKLILHPITASSSEIEETIVIILDAMDECGDPLTREELLQSLETSFSKLPQHFRLLITSRPEPDLHDLLYTHPLVLPFKLGPEASKRDVSTYLSIALANVFKRRGAQPVPEGWPWDENIEFLGMIASGLFIWASTTCKHVEQSGTKEFQVLERLINDIRAHGRAEFGIGPLYSTVLLNASLPWEDEEFRFRFSRVLHLILEVDVALSADDIDIILDLSPQSSSRLIISKLQSVLTYTSGSHSRVRPLHASFGDFLTSSGQSQSPWYIDFAKNREHIDNQRLLVSKQCLSSFDIIDRMLSEISGNIETFFKQRDHMPNLPNRFAENLTTDLRNACLMWPQQLRISPFSQELLDRLSHFLHEWIEVMFVVGKLDLVDSMLEDCVTWVAGHNTSLEPLIEDARKRVRDAQPYLNSVCIMDRMLRFNICDIETSFKLNKDISGLHKRIGEKISNDLKRACLSWAEQLFISPPSRIVICALSYLLHGHLLSWLEVLSLIKNVEWARPMLEKATEWVAGNNTSLESFLRDACKLISTFETPISESLPHIYVSMLPFACHKSDAVSHCSRSISPGTKVKIFGGGYQGALKDTFNGHTELITSLAYSPDGKHVVSGSFDCTVIVWNVESGEIVAGPFIGHSDWVYSVAYSTDGKHVVSGSADCTVIVWNVESGEIVAGPFKGHLSYVLSVAYSPDGKHVVSCSDNGTVIVWNVESGEIVAGPFKGHSDWVYSVAYSPDGKHVVSCSADRTVIVWNVESGEIVAGPFKGHSGWVRSVAYSPDGKHVVSCSDDCTVIVWNAESGEIVAGPFKGHSSIVYSVAYSPDGKHVVSCSADRTVIVWNVKSGKIVAGPFKGQSGIVWSVAYSPDGNHVVSGSFDGTIRIWDAVVEVAPSASNINTEWELSKDGWIHGRQGKLLLWVPPDMRKGLYYPRNTVVINCQTLIKLHFMEDKIGENWTQCIELQE